ncbi:MAG: hypothetical protein M3R68_00160, partial [Acidobacteriota bacterium]|nr:hypothetical protein [Acidobacteriota bacterium]
MTQIAPKFEADARRFLLGEMSAAERSAFEERFVADAVSFEQIRVIEDELIESYVRDTLSEREKEKFEREFLASERRRTRVAFTRTMLDKLVQPREIAAVKKSEAAGVGASFWQSLGGFFKTPQLVFGAALALLVLVFGGWLLLRTANAPEVARQVMPTPNPTIEPNQKPSPNVTGKAPEKIQNSPTQKKTPTDVPMLALLAGGVRGEGKLPELSLPKGASAANLQLNIRLTYTVYRAEIVDTDGNLIWRSTALKAKHSKLNLFVPAAKLPEGDYIVR